MLLILLSFVIIYLLISLVIILVVITWARRNHRRMWLWGILAASIMCYLVFWDFIPSLIMHKYYCTTQAGFWVYKSPEQWKAENPNIAEMLVTKKDTLSVTESNRRNYTYTTTLNQRFNWVNKHSSLHIDSFRKHESIIIDNKNDEVMARYINFSVEVLWNGIATQNFWEFAQNCENNSYQNSRIMNTIKENFEQIAK